MAEHLPIYLEGHIAVNASTLEFATQQWHFIIPLDTEQRAELLIQKRIELKLACLNCNDLFSVSAEAK